MLKGRYDCKDLNDLDDLIGRVVVNGVIPYGFGLVSIARAGCEYINQLLSTSAVKLLTQATCSVDRHVRIHCQSPIR